jgi:hypothetical protein
LRRVCGVAALWCVLKDLKFRFLMKPYDSQQLHEALLSMHVKPRERAPGQS